MLLPNDRTGLRGLYLEAWRKRRERLPAEQLEVQIADVIEAHPEYHALLEQAEAALGGEWTPGGGETNPFLHLSLHLALRDQVATDRPAGIAAQHRRLAAQLGRHEAEHRMMDCLAQALWQAERNQSPPDEVSYLQELRRIQPRRVARSG